MKKIHIYLIVILFSNTSYAGEWSVTSNGCKVWNKKPEVGEEVKWDGKCKDGFVNGIGSLSWITNGKTTEKHEGEWKDGKANGWVTSFFLESGNKYIGPYRDGERNGLGTYIWENGDVYKGEFKNGLLDGYGIKSSSRGVILKEGVWERGKFIREEKLNFATANNNDDAQKNRDEIEREKKQLTEERKRLEEEKIIKEQAIENDKKLLAEERRKIENELKAREQARNSQRINLQVTYSQPNAEGDFAIQIQTGTDTASLKINGEEFGGRADGNYVIRKVARAGQETKFTIVAKDTNGNVDTKPITVTRQITASNQIAYAELNPALIKTQPSKDAVAIIIGIQNYKRVPKAEFANVDAQAFYDYAIRALGVKPENIKLLVDEQADDVEILTAFNSWLPVKVRKQKTDVYVFYSGHGLPSDDGNSLYILPYGADKQFIAKTAINQQDIIAALQASQPKSVTMFMDACYSGQIRTGETLIASARPISIKSNAQSFPSDFTVITASQSDQIASSSPDFKHGIFSYYLMKGMEGDADENKDNKITAGELQSYLQDMVGRKAMSVNRKQIPQLTGDANRVLIGK